MPIQAAGGVTGSAGAVDAVVDLQARAHQVVRDAFPIFKKRELIDPPDMDAFHRTLLQLPLCQPQPGESAEVLMQKGAENRRRIYNCLREFAGSAGKPVYVKMIDKALALSHSREILRATENAPLQPAVEILKNKLDGLFDVLVGIDGLTRTLFYEAMMSGDEEFEQEW